MITMRASLTFMVSAALLGGALLGSGCRKVSVAKPDQPSVTKPPPVVSTKPVAPVVAKEAVAPASKPGFFASLFGGKSSQSADHAATQTSSTPTTPVTANVDTNRSYVPYRIQINDTLMIALRSITPEQPNIDLIVDENGEIKLPYINSIKADGKTTSELETLIRDTYINQKIYKRMTVNVIVPAMTSPTFYIKGEVRSPGRLPYVNGMTLLTAIAAAGGPSDFFTPNMELLRGGKKIKFNYYDLEKHPDQDQPIQAGDIIIVYKSWL